MANVLISWVALNNDFVLNEVNRNGPNFSFHTHFFSEFDRHILLCTESESDNYSKGLRLFSEIRKSFPLHDVDLRILPIAQKDVINFNLIRTAIYPITLEFNSDVLSFFVSPGTPTMQVVWYFIHLENKRNTRLIQTIKSEDSASGNPTLFEINFEDSPISEFLLMHENSLSFKYNVAKESSYEFLITESLIPIFKLVHEIALSQKTTVLIQGETGTGKEFIAKEIRRLSARSKKPYRAINCGAISPDLLESRLFGYEKGAFNNALKTTNGYFHVVDNGTIFLDEIGDINPQMQIALLRLLQEGEIQKVGSNDIEKVDVRIIAATNKNLYEECEQGRFRWDLYYRLCIAEIILPPLRQRSAKEIVLLLDFFNHKFHELLGKKRKLLQFSAETMSILVEHYWPGNIRELQNLVERCYAYGLEIIKPNDLPDTFKSKNIKHSLVLEDVIRKHIKNVVLMTQGNLTRAKELLDLGSINTIKKYLK